MGTSQRTARQLLAFLVLGLVAVLILAACGGASALLEDVGAPVPGSDRTAQGQDTAISPEGAILSPEGEGPATGGTDADGNPSSAMRDDLKIVYTGSLQLVVEDLPQALAKGRAAVAAVGGYIGASEVSNEGERSVATITYRIPASRWEESVAALRGLATEVVFEQTRATEVGGQIVDLEARLRNLRASETSLVEIAKGTGKISDLLLVEEQLTQIRGQIEQLDAQRAQLEDQVAYGSLVTTYGTEIVAVQETAKGWDPTGDVDGALATLIGVCQAIVSAGIWFAIVWLPLLLVLLLLALIARIAYRRYGPRPRATQHDPIPGWGGEAGA